MSRPFKVEVPLPTPSTRTSPKALQHPRPHQHLLRRPPVVEEGQEMELLQLPSQQPKATRYVQSLTHVADAVEIGHGVP